MKSNQNMMITEEFLKKMYAHAEETYPDECCGMLMRSADNKTWIRLRPCKNVQNEYHDRDPETYTRTAQTAYLIDAKEILQIQKENRERNEQIGMIYHSHVDTGSYFSEEDVRVATFEGEPAYPGVLYLVMSVLKGKVNDHSIYEWNESEKEFKKI